MEKYSLSKDVAKSQRHPKVGAAGMDHLQPPLVSTRLADISSFEANKSSQLAQLVMNNFTTGSTDPKTQQTKTPIPKHLETLTTTTFQSLFPPISPQRTPLSTIRRVLLVNREIPAFPQPLDPSSVSENGGKESQPYILNFRHYAITTKPLLPLSRGIKRLHSASQHANTRSHKPQSRDYPISPPPNTNPGSNADSDAPAQTTSAPKNLKSSRARKGGLPDLSHLPDVADYILPAAEGGCGRGWTSASESEADLTEAEVEVLEGRVKRVWGRKEREERRQAALEAQQQSAPDPANGDGEANPGDQENGEQKPRKRALPRTQKHALKLTELGPRMRLRLYKVEEGLCGGKVLWHESVEKTREEEREMDRVWEGRRREREARRRVQRENVERKRKEKEERSGKTKEGGNLDSKQQNQKQEEDESEGETDEEAWDDVMDEEMEDEDGGEVDEDGEMEVDE